MTLVVIGLDAADVRLAEQWELSSLLLDNHQALETFAHSRDIPLTSEVWPAIATGQHPSEGGVEGRRGSDWSGAMALVNRVAKHIVPKSYRAKIGRRLRQGQSVEAHFGPTEEDHVFANGAVYNWPSITPAQNWARADWWLGQYYGGEIDDLEFLRRQMAFTGEELGWCMAMAQTWLPIVGTRCHILDHAGHAFADHPEKLQHVYELVDDLVSDVRGSSGVTDVVICSDHGMQTSICGDESPGSHSWNAIVSSTIDSPLPNSVLDVREYLERHVSPAPKVQDEWRERDMDTPIEHLEELGYIN